MHSGNQGASDVHRQRWFREIERLRAELHRTIDEADGNLQDERVREVAAKLDDALNRYMSFVPTPE